MAKSATSKSKASESQQTLFQAFGVKAKAKAAAPKAKPSNKATKKPKKSGDDDEDFEENDANASDNDSDFDAQPSDEDNDAEEPEEDEDEDGGSGSKSSRKAKGLDLSLPPISDISIIFSDVVKRVPQLKEIAEHLSGRTLRVATMCSGTESPLLALDMIKECIKNQYKEELRVDHVFSCEIEPFKQAYIERNFHPPLLFRDVCELGDDEAHTAYGALAPVPGDVDMLIAGTSCVDYSNLNNSKKDIDAGGESGRTFRGMMSWVGRHRPPLVILENVCKAPWDKVVKKFEEKGYSAAFARLDTKEFYIPHTRTRVYLIAVDRRSSNAPKKCIDFVKNHKRFASSTIESFLLPNDDPRIHEERAKLVQESYNSESRRTGRTDWTRCQSRHANARVDEALGQKRPATRWQEGGKCQLSADAWKDWGDGQVERVWDLMDIELLRAAKKSIDPNYKTLIWNLSQNVDRNIGTSSAGISPCLTPSMIPYITNRGGPMTGLEALSLQGLPIEKLLLTKETEDNLADLAGNAMSTTVVGTCIIAALVVGKNLLKSGEDKETYESKSSKPEASAMDVDIPKSSELHQDRVEGEDWLVTRSVDLAHSAKLAEALDIVLDAAKRSSRLCTCEGRTDVTTSALTRCIDCGTSICEKCAGHPEHNMQPLVFNDGERISPSSFVDRLAANLPMCLHLSGIDEATLDAAKSSAAVKIPDDIWSKWTAAVLRASDSELRFLEVRRQEEWMAVYQSPTASLELILHPQQPEWRFYAKPLITEPANAKIREILQQPVGRFSCIKGLIKGAWSFALPYVKKVKVTVQGTGDLVPTWENRLGLIDHLEQKAWSSLKVEVPDSDRPHFDRDISGEYTLLPRCGTANAALHKRVTASDDTLPPLFMLFDPDRITEQNDSFVFSISKRRYEHNESRPLLARLDPDWRPSASEEAQEVTCSSPCTWVSSEAVHLEAVANEVKLGLPGQTAQVTRSDDACQTAQAFLAASVPLNGQAGPEWSSTEYTNVSSIDERSVLKGLAWLLEPVRRFDSSFFEWHHVIDVAVNGGSSHNCERCAPTPPDIAWRIEQQKKKSIVVPREDPVQAGKYERSLKARPAPFVTQLRIDDAGVGSVRIGLNIPSLLHRAMSRLPRRETDSRVQLSWRLNTNYTPAVSLNLAKFTLSSNKNDPKHAQPPNFKLKLRPEQRRSLDWMVKREAADVEMFTEEEVVEACSLSLGWRAEGRATRETRIRGGVLADQVGYGKTAVTLGLLDVTQDDIQEEFKDRKDIHGKILSPATLIVVPAHLTGQWEKEVTKFTGKTYSVVVLKTLTQLNKLSIEDVIDADIIIVASTLFKAATYLENLTSLAGTAPLPNSEGRHFQTSLDSVLESLKERTETLKRKGGRALLATMKDGQKKAMEEAAAAEKMAQSKRLKGQKYAEAAFKVEAAKEATKKTAAVPQKAKANSKGLIPEVVITTTPGTSSRSSSSSFSRDSTMSTPPTTPGEDMDVDTETTRSRRPSAKRRLVLSDDEDDDEPVSSKSKRPRRSEADSDADFEVPDDSSDAESSAASSAGASTSSIEAKPEVKARFSASETSSDDEMKVDQPVKNTKKHKSTGGDEKRPAKKTRLDTNPWKLDTHEVKKDWKQAKAPTLEMFHFGRVVVDEYTYLDGKAHTVITSLTADRKWVLSGTPPVHNFAAVRTIAAFMNIHLGISDGTHINEKEAKKLMKDLTAVERFYSYIDVPTVEWQTHRQAVAQRFLDMFVRQNIAEIDEIPMEEKKVEIELPASEYALYLELEHYLRAQDMIVKRISKKKETQKQKEEREKKEKEQAEARKKESVKQRKAREEKEARDRRFNDREMRLNDSLGDSDTAQEALLKACSHFRMDPEPRDAKVKAKSKGTGKGKKKANDDSDEDDDEADDDEPVSDDEDVKLQDPAAIEKLRKEGDNAVTTCDLIVQAREAQLESCKEDLVATLKEGVQIEKDLASKAVGETSFNIYVSHIQQGEGVDDTEAHQVVKALLEEAGVGPAKDKFKPVGDLDGQTKDLVKVHRENTHDIRRLTKELCGRLRSLRYFRNVRDLQRPTKEGQRPLTVTCPGCERKEVSLAEISLLSSCGHLGCQDCVKRRAGEQLCVDKTCKANSASGNIVHAKDLGHDKPADSDGDRFGEKLERVVKIIKEEIPKKERVLLFVQFKDLLNKVSQALDIHKIEHIQIEGSAIKQSKALESFKDGDARVLLLEVMDERASGANLTIANHAIFLSPLLAPSKELYDAAETQAVGRVRRYGQTKHVIIWKCVTRRTIEEEIWNVHHPEEKKREERVLQSDQMDTSP